MVLRFSAGRARVEAMAMANGYMPRADLAALRWMKAFARGLAERPAVYKATPEEIESVTLAVQAFAAAFAVAEAPATRTTGAVATKDNRRVDAERACRPVYARIKADPSIETEDLLAIGVRPINPARSRIGKPTEAPVVWLAEDRGHTHVLKYRAEDTQRRAKPAGAAALQLFRRWEGGPETYVGTFTRNPMRVECDPRDDLKVATYRARWITRRGLVGPWGPAVRARVNCVNVGRLDRAQAA